MRLDQAIFARGLTDSREKARRLIRQGCVTVNGEPVLKPALEAADDADIRVNDADHFVGRGAYKLQAALEEFGEDLTGCVCMDIGASTGGFTEVMLRRGAKRVFAVDVGTDQLADRLKADPRVIDLEKTDARTLTQEMLGCDPDFCSVDVSFISLSYIIPPLAERFGCRFVTLIKPQFEAGRADIGKGGIVKKPAAHVQVLRRFCAMLQSAGLTLTGLTASPITGGDGNIEYLAAFRKGGDGIRPDLDTLVRKAFEDKKSGLKGS